MGQNEAPGFFIKVAYYSCVTSCCYRFQLVMKLFLFLTDAVWRATKRKDRKLPVWTAIFLSQPYRKSEKLQVTVHTTQFYILLWNKNEWISQFPRHPSIRWFHLSVSTHLYLYQQLYLGFFLLPPVCIQPGTQCISRFPDIVRMRVSDNKTVQLIPAPGI